MLLAVFDSEVDQLSILGLLGGGEDERWVGCGVLRLVLLNSCRLLVWYSRGGTIHALEVAGVADNGLYSD